MRKIECVTASELARMLYERFCTWRQDRNCSAWLDGVLPLSTLEALGMGSSRRHAYQILCLAMERLPIVIEDSSYDWMIQNKLRHEVGNLKKVSTLAGYCRIWARVSRRPWMRHATESDIDEEFKKNIRYTIDFSSVRFDFGRNVLLGYLPPGFVKRLMGWQELKYCSVERAVYGNLPPHEEGRRSRWAREHCVGVAITGRNEESIIDVAEELELFISYSQNADVLNVSVAGEILILISERIESPDGLSREELARLHRGKRRIVELLKKQGYSLSDDMSTVVREFKPKSLLYRYSETR